MTTLVQAPESPPVFLLDAHSHLHRAYHAVSGLTTSTGFPTNALFGFLSILNRLVKTYNPMYLGAVFDSPGPCFRSVEYPAYKINRPPLPEELRVQIAKVKEILAAMEIPCFEVPTFEADDLLATLASQAETAHMETWIVSVDKDLFQLVTDKTKMLRTHQDGEEVVDRIWVKQHLGVVPDQVVDYLGLVGDSSDNIPGVRGIGPKSAVQLLERFGNLENLLAHTQEIENPRWRRLIEESLDQARLSYRLALLRKDAPVQFDPVKLARKTSPSPNPKLMQLYRELEFRAWIQETGGLKLEDRKVDYKGIRTSEELRQFATEAQQFGRFAIDTETTGLDPFTSDLVGISVSVRPQSARYIPIGHDSQAAEGPQLPIEMVREILGPVLADPKIQKILQHVQFDYKILSRAGLNMEGVGCDTMLASYLLNPERKSHGLKALALELLGVEMTHIDALIGDGELMTMAQVNVSEAQPYACQDADLTFQLADYFAPRLIEADLDDVLRTIEVPLAPILAEMELTGVRIDQGHFAQLRKDTESRLREIAQQAFQLVGRPFNLGSTKQIAQILFEELHLPTKRKGKTGYSTDVEVLEELYRDTSHPLLALLLEHRAADKLLNTYIVALPRLVHPSTGRIHTSFNQTITATGRLSSSEPNLQNIPVRTPQGRMIRRGFIPSSPNHVFLSADYSQIELRLLAHVTGDPGLVEAFQQGMDVHQATAAKVFGCPREQATDDMRSQAKIVNFGVIYGISAHGLSMQLGISHGEAEKFIQEYFVAYPGVKRWIDSAIETARTKGYVRTLKGRRRFIPDINSPQVTVRRNAERIAINTPIQGSSADMIKLAMIAIHRRMSRERMRARMILQVHDELIFDAPVDEVEALRGLVRDEMERALPLQIPVRVDLKTGPNWAEC